MVVVQDGVDPLVANEGEDRRRRVRRVVVLAGTDPGSFTEPLTRTDSLYFVVTVFATVGFGDITPLSLSARYAAVAEAITGQFYLTILVARLVGMRQSQLVVPEPRS